MPRPKSIIRSIAVPYGSDKHREDCVEYTRCWSMNHATYSNGIRAVRNFGLKSRSRDLSRDSASKSTKVRLEKGCVHFLPAPSKRG